MRMRYKNREPVKCKRCYEGPGERERDEEKRESGKGQKKRGQVKG